MSRNIQYITPLLLYYWSVYIICTNMLPFIVRIFAFCLWFSYITSTARGCYLCALQNKPHSALLCCTFSLSLPVDAIKILYTITFWDHVTSIPFFLSLDPFHFHIYPLSYQYLPLFILLQQFLIKFDIFFSEW